MRRQIAIVEDEYAWDKVVARIEDVSRRVVVGEALSVPDKVIAPS